MIKIGIFIAYRRNIDLHQLTGVNHIFKIKVVRNNTKQPKQSGHYTPCLSRMNNLCCKQVKQTKKFESYRVKDVFQIFHNLTCKRENLIYLLQCNAVYANFSTLGKVRILSTSDLTVIGKMLNHKPQYWHIKISTNKTKFSTKCWIEQIKNKQLLKKQEHF